jgi:predicted Rossmann-fold nucleotide-binding protein
MLEKMVKKGFLSMDNLELLIVDDQIDNLLKKMKNFKDPQKPKWLTNERT